MLPLLQHHLLQLSIRQLIQIVLKCTYQPELTQGGLRKLTVSKTTTLKLKLVQCNSKQVSVSFEHSQNYTDGSVSQSQYKFSYPQIKNGPVGDSQIIG